MNFDKQIKTILEDCVAGGADSVFTTGSIQAGQYGNQFPAQNDLAYAPGDARYPFYNTSKKTKKKRKKAKFIQVQRRILKENQNVFDQLVAKMDTIIPGEFIITKGLAKKGEVAEAVELVLDKSQSLTVYKVQWRVKFVNSQGVSMNDTLYYTDIDWELTNKVKGMTREQANHILNILDI